MRFEAPLGSKYIFLPQNQKKWIYWLKINQFWCITLWFWWIITNNMSFKKFKMAAGRHFEKGAVAQIPQRYKNSIRSYFVQDHLNYQKMQKPRLPLSGVPSLCWHPDYYCYLVYAHLNINKKMKHWFLSSMRCICKMCYHG